MFALGLLLIVSALPIACGDESGGGATQDRNDDATYDAGGSVPQDVFPSAGGRPGKRSDVAAAYDSSSKSALIFGGDNGPIINQTPHASYLGDSWLVTMADGWMQVAGSGGPSERGRYAVAVDSSQRVSYFFGGRWRAAGTTGTYTLYHDLWAFDFETRAWSLVDAGSRGAPTPRYFSAAAFDQDRAALILWGGDTDPSALGIRVSNDVWAYADGSWSQRRVTGSPPSARLWVAYTHDSRRNRLVVFGGQVGDFVTPSFNDTYALSLSDDSWTVLHDGTGTAPSGRFSSAMVYDPTGDRYLLFGGHADAGVTNDVWAYDPEANSWSLFRGGDTFTGAELGCLGNPREIPQGYMAEDLTAPERRSTPAVWLAGSELWVFGGESDCSDHLDDLWRLDLSTRKWSEISEAQSGESCSRRNDACECLCL